MWPAGLPINATILELIVSLPTRDLHSGYEKELAGETERSCRHGWLQKFKKSLPLNTAVVLDMHIDEINKLIAHLQTSYMAIANMTKIHNSICVKNKLKMSRG